MNNLFCRLFAHGTAGASRGLDVPSPAVRRAPHLRRRVLGSRRRHAPAKVPVGPRPLIVVLHGCTQTAAAYESAGWSDLADEWGFYVLYPEQNTTRNNSSGCFNWGGRWKSAPQTFVLTPEALDLNEIARGQGENESIKEMIDKMKADHAIDDKRVFVTGLSGGGAMTALMLAVWPDVFSGGAIFAGIPYGCATNKKTTAEAGECLKSYTGADAYLSRTPAQWGDLVRTAAPSFKGPYPRVSIWHGTSDSVVNNANQTELVKQWTNANANGIDQTADANDSVDGFPHAAYKDASGKTLVETYTITGQSHGTEVAPSAPIDPAQPGGAKCGKAGAYILSAGICSTYYAAKFFGLDGAGIGGARCVDGRRGLEQRRIERQRRRRRRRQRRGHEVHARKHAVVVQRDGRQRQRSDVTRARRCARPRQGGASPIQSFTILSLPGMREGPTSTITAVPGSSLSGWGCATTASNGSSP